MCEKLSHIFNFQFSILNFIRIFAPDIVERFAALRVPDSLQPHKKMLKVNLFKTLCIDVAAPLSVQTLGLFNFI